MSTSFERRVQNFQYPVIPPPVLRRQATEDPADDSAQKARELAMQQELAAAVEAARKEGFRLGEAQAQAAAAQAIEQERTAVLSALQDFEGRRDDYFRRVETEVVRLALAIARKVLHREAQMDPLLLAGVVRVALDQMQSGTRVVLRASPDSAELWCEFCEQRFQGKQIVEVVADSSLEEGRCLLQAEVGSSEISLDSQLQEIESGFFDLLRERPPTPPSAATALGRGAGNGDRS
jgi:flagellar assembly protein FliH